MQRNPSRAPGWLSAFALVLSIAAAPPSRAAGEDKEGAERVFSFEKDAVGSVPEGWRVAETSGRTGRRAGTLFSGAGLRRREIASSVP